MKLPSLKLPRLPQFISENFHIPQIQIPKLLRSNVFDINQQAKVLKKLIHTSQNTLFGKYYRYERILARKDWFEARRQTVPIHDYDSMFQQWWRRQLEGDENITRPGKVSYYALSSGTTGSTSKYLPVTTSLLQSIYKGGYLQIASLLKHESPLSIFGHQSLFLGGSTSLQQYQGYFAGDMSGIMQKYAPVWISRIRKPGPTISKLPSRQDRIEEIVKQAPKRDIGTIVGLPSWTALILQKIIDRHELQTIFDIRPHLKIMVYSGMSLDPYKEKFEALFGGKVHLYESYNASEGYFGYCTDKSGKGFSFMCNNQIFYELYPLHDYVQKGIIEPTKTVLLDQAQEHVDYILIISSCGGAWRYVIGDTVQCIDAKKNKFQISGRTKHYISLCGEHCTVDNFNQTIEQVRQRFGLEGSEYTVIGTNGEKPHHERRIGTNKENLFQQETLGCVIDDILSSFNDDYAVERSGPLGAPKVNLIDEKLFIQFLIHELGAQAQTKFPRVLNEKQHQNRKNFLSSQV